MRIRSMLSKTTLPVVLLTIIMLFACNSASVVADEKEPASPPKGPTGRLLVPAAPNQSIVKGTVSAYCVVSARLLNIKPADQTLYKITLLIESSENAKSFRNFIKDKEGEDIEFYTKEKQLLEIFGKRIKARASYTGDERGGSYWIRDIELIPGK